MKILHLCAGVLEKKVLYQNYFRDKEKLQINEILMPLKRSEGNISSP